MKKKKSEFILFISPMLLETVWEPFDSQDHYFEIKLNGVRLLLHRKNGKNSLYSRHGTTLSGRIPELDDIELEDDVMLDGELVCYNKDFEGKEDFEGTLSRINSSKESSILKGVQQFPLTYVVFDILHKKQDLTKEPLHIRKQLLVDTLIDQPTIKKCSYIENDGISLFEKVKDLNLEGIVSKEKASTYSIGKRSSAWKKTIAWQYEDVFLVGYAKHKIGWVIADKIDEKIKVCGVVEFGISPEQKKAFYQVVQQIKTGENKEYVFIEPLLKCKIRGRGRLRSSMIMTPVFVDFITT